MTETVFLYILSGIGAATAAIIGVVFRMQSQQIHEIATEVKELDTRLRFAITGSDVRQIIDDKLKPMQVQLAELQSDIKEIKEMVRH